MPKSGVVVELIVSIDPNEAVESAHRGSDGFSRLMASMPEMLDGQPAVLRTVPSRMTQQEDMFSEDWEF